MAEQGRPRQRRAKGEQSRRKILDAAAEVAGERGYEGTTIALVCQKSDLPASSVYWHFTDKDALIAAVIERSFQDWLAAITLPEGQEPEAALTEMALQVARALLASPDFLRLGLMLALERRPEEPRARTMFLEVRAVAYDRVVEVLSRLAPGADPASVALVATYALAAADGLFIARELGGDDVDLVGLFALHARLVHQAAAELLGPGRDG